MSKNKRQYTVRMDPGEAVVVAPVGFWEQLMEHCEETAREFPEYEEGWMDARNHIEDWLATSRSFDLS